jgi:anti-sigma factor (TIGR02949 family)
LSEISCNEVLAEIQAFVDGELPADRSVDLAEHLIECSPCLDRADFQRKLKEILRTKCGPSTDSCPEHVTLRVRSTIWAHRGPAGPAGPA